MPQLAVYLQLIHCPYCQRSLFPLGYNLLLSIIGQIRLGPGDKDSGAVSVTVSLGLGRTLGEIKHGY